MTPTSSAPPTVLVTGFDPFGGHTLNPSGQLALALDGTSVAGATIVGRRFATAASTVAGELSAALDEIAPDVLICLGLAPGRPAISLERIAVNVQDFPVPDNAGATPTDVPIEPGGPDGRFSRLPIRAILGRWQAEDVPGHISDTAGTYLCNQLFYLACAAGERLRIPAGFIHIPDTPASARFDRGPGATMAFETIRRGVELAVEIVVGGTDAVPAPVGTGAIA